MPPGSSGPAWNPPSSARYQLGAHFTPRAYVERLVLPTVIEPLRAEWENVRAAAITHARAGDLKNARTTVNAFHDELCNLKVLDPACGTGNFLYVALQHLKILEGEVLDFAAQFGDTFKLELATHTIDPHQFLGLEINPRAAAIAELVLWIGYLQWHFRLHGKRTPPEPILRAFKNIQCRDAVLAYDGEPQPVTWAMALANPDLPGLPDEVRAKLRRSRREEAHSNLKRDSASGLPLTRPPATLSPSDGERGGLPSSRSRGDETPTSSPSRDRILLTSAPTVITVWDRRSMKTDLVTGRDVPDETRRVPLLAYANPRPAEWPKADFIVGNPPFLGKVKLREDLGDGYVEALRAAYSPEVPESADFVLYWWHKAATLVRAGQARRFGLITTNSLRQTFARRVVQFHLEGRSRGDETHTSKEQSQRLLTSSPTKNEGTSLSLVFAIPDHPWVDTAEGAAVRIAMTVGVAGEHPGELLEVTAEQPQDDGSEKVTFNSQRGKISADLTVGANVADVVPLKANEGLSSNGCMLGGRGFLVRPESTLRGPTSVIRPIVNGSDLLQERRNMRVIDFFGFTEEEARKAAPDAYQQVLTQVKPERDANRRSSRRERWWLFGEVMPQMRSMVRGIRRYIATSETAKHRIFQFLDPLIVPEHKLVVIGSDDAYLLGILSSHIHVVYSLAAGSWLGVGNDPVYAKSRCFDPFPFPLCGEAQKERIRKLAEELDAHRKRVQAQHGLTLTALYNVLEKIRGCRSRREEAHTSSPAESESRNLDSYELTPKEKLIHDRGLVSVLKQLHDDLDAAVADAYNWPWPLTDAEILTRLVALNAERAAEEQRGIIHWLRPEYQTGKPKTESGKQKELSLTEGEKARGLPPAATSRRPRTPKRPEGRAPKKQPWPKALAERVKAVEAALHRTGAPTPPAELAQQFQRAKPADVAEILETLVTLGRARKQGGKFTR